MRKRTTIDLDMDLVKAASRALGTDDGDRTVHAALDEVARRGQRLALVGFVPAIDLGDLEQMRSNRLVEAPE